MVNPIRDMFSWVDASPQALAVKSIRLEMTYSDFADTVRRVATKLRQVGLKPGQVVGLRLQPELQAVFVAAVMHEGAVSFAAKANNVQAYLHSIDLLITDDPRFEAGHPNRQVISPDWLGSTAHLNARVEPNDFASSESLALLVFSSGTTGTPKGVAFSIADVLARIESAHANWMPAKPFLAELGLDTVSGIQTYFYNLIHGETYLISTSASETIELVESQSVRSIKTSPAKLLDLVRAAAAQNNSLEGLRTIQVAGGLISEYLGRETANTLSAEVRYLYGSTEVGTVTSGPFRIEQPNQVGEVLSDAQVQIIDQSGEIAQVGARGTIRIKTPYQANGYWNNVEKTATGFIDGWFYPGDTGSLTPTGSLKVEGRIDELLNVGGSKLNPAWVDSVVDGLRGLQDHAAFAAQDAISGEPKLALAIVAASTISIQSLSDKLRELLGGSAPEIIVRLDKIPRNELGKPLRAEISKIYATQNTKEER